MGQILVLIGVGLIGVGTCLDIFKAQKPKMDHKPDPKDPIKDEIKPEPKDPIKDLTGT